MTKSGLCFLSLLLLGGCASERVVLLPSSDGRPSALVVREGDGSEILLDKPYAATVRRVGTTSSYHSSPEEVRERYSATLSARPAAPKTYLLYFEEGSNQLTPASQEEFERIKGDIRQQAAAEVMVIGHSDRVGSAQSNETLSLRRAEAVRAWLQETGVPGERLEAVGRGEREPLVPTEDEIAEPRNRRVEINLR